MPVFFRIRVCAILLGACLLAGKADASPAEPLAGTNIDGVFCGVGHDNPELEEKTAHTGEVDNAIPVSPILTQAAVKGLLKCHLANHLASDSAINHKCQQMKCCDSTAPGGSAPGGFISWNITMETVGADKCKPGTVNFIANTVSQLLRPDSPEPRPPASITV